jgi:hypothetical protein
MDATPDCAIFFLTTKPLAKLFRRIFAEQLRPKMPRLAALMDQAEAGVLAYMAFPSAYRIVGIFPDEDAITRLIRANR